MNGESTNHAWRVIGRSVCGASHRRNNRPNQDAIAWTPRSETGLPLVMAVSDGHGGARYIRSQEGARLAVEVATTVIPDMLGGQQDRTNLSAIKRTVEERWPVLLTQQWKKAVYADLEQRPLQAEELDALEASADAASRRDVEATPLLAYGATLLTVAITPGFLLYLQLGDGEILTVSAAGEVGKPLPGDERLFANATTSLCSPDAWRDFRCAFQAVYEAPPALILLCTDGYANAFRTEADFLRVGSDYLRLIREDGMDSVDTQMEGWLTEASEAGSGDDITLAISCRIDTRNEERISDQEAGP